MTQTTISWLRPMRTYATSSCAARPQEGICNLFLPPVAQVVTNSAAATPRALGGLCHSASPCALSRAGISHQILHWYFSSYGKSEDNLSRSTPLKSHTEHCQNFSKETVAT